MVVKNARIFAAAAIVATIAFVVVALRVRARFSTVVYGFASVGGGPFDAVAVREGKIVDVGMLSDLSGAGRVVGAYRSLVAYPGFVDRVNLASAALALSADAIFAPEAWPKPGGGEWPAVAGKELFEVVLSTAAREKGKPGIFFAFGWHEPAHGELTRARLDSLFPARAVVVMARSCTRFVANGAASKALGLASTPAAATGVYRGAAALSIASRLGRANGSQRAAEGAKILADHLSSVGVTGVRDTTSSSAVVRWARGAFGKSALSVGYSIDPMAIVAEVGPERAGGAITAELEVCRGGVVGWSDPPVAMLRLDGGFAEGKNQSKTRPAKDGAWIWEPAHVDAMCRMFLESGYGVRYETNGDFAVETALSQFHRRAFEGVSPPDPSRFEILAVESDGALSASRAAAVDVRMSFDCGFDGGSVAPIGAFGPADGQVGLHSSMPSGGVGPSDPLAVVACASERPGGNRVTRKRAVEISTTPIARGSRADFVLFDVDPAVSKTASVKGVVFGGTPVAPRRSWKTAKCALLAQGVSTGGDDRAITPSDVGDAFVRSAMR
jgi:predicted amidohydrolase YtcJ